MFFAYCILLKRTEEEFWNARPSQIIYCVDKYRRMISGEKTENNNTVEEITSMHQIPGWGAVI